MIRVALHQRDGKMVRPRLIGALVIFGLERVAGLAIRKSDADRVPEMSPPVGMGCRHRVARSMRCARPSDLHPIGRIAGFPARMRATSPAGSGGDGRRGMPLSVAGSPVFRVEAGTAGTCERGDGGAAAGRGPS